MIRFIRERKFILIIILILLVGGFYTWLSQQMEMKKLQEERIQLQKELEFLEARKAKLLEEIEKSGDLGYVEVIARERLKMVKPDEIIYIVYD